MLNKRVASAEVGGILFSMSLAPLQTLPDAATLLPHADPSSPVRAEQSAKSKRAAFVAEHWHTAEEAELVSAERTRSSGLVALDAMLPSGGLPVGRVIELAVAGSAWGTRVGFLMCRVAQQQARQTGGSGWCAFIDPSGSLYAPGAASLGIDLERLLVVRPSWETLERVAVRMAEARLFSVLVIDSVGVLPDATVRQSPPSRWQRTVKRLALAIRGTAAQVVLLTDQARARPLPLPVGLRLELTQLEAEHLCVQVTKEHRGRVGSKRVIAWEGSPNANYRLLGNGDQSAVAPLAKCSPPEATVLPQRVSGSAQRGPSPIS